MKLECFCIILIFAFVCKAQVEPEYEVGLRMVGCFADVKNDRALPVLYANFRNQIDWSNMNETIKQCADGADHNGYRWFGIQFYGECWSGPSASTTYDKHGISTNCRDGVGAADANAVYQFYLKK
eukprot:gene14098-15570_t